MSQIHGFSVAMKFIIFFIYIPLVYSEYHKLYTGYTGLNEQTAPGIQEFLAETRLDYQQIDYYDSNIKKMVPKQDWMKEFTSTEMWKEDTKIREDVHQIYKNNIPVIMQRFNQSGGVHIYQRMYGCDYDDKTEVSVGFDRYTYDGNEFITLGVKELRYTAHVPQAIPTVEKWNNDKERFTVLKRYYDHECVYWLKELLALKARFERRETSKANFLTFLMCVMGGAIFLVIGTVFIKMKKRNNGYKRVSSQEETSDKKMKSFLQSSALSPDFSPVGNLQDVGDQILPACLWDTLQC